MYANRLSCTEYPVKTLDGRTVADGIRGLWQPNANVRDLGISFLGDQQFGEKGVVIFGGLGFWEADWRIRYTRGA